MARADAVAFPRLALALAAAWTIAAAPARAQSDYYNTDRNRPIRIEDAYAAERYSFDAHLAPIRLERSAGGVYTWAIDPEVAYGVFPRTQLELGVPLVYTDLSGGATRAGLTGIDVSVLYTLNVETATYPALGVRASVLTPVGSLAPDRAYPSLQGMATRTFRGVRVHVNGAYTFGSASGVSGGATGAGADEVSRWLGGVALDRTLPLRSLLMTAEMYARRPLGDDYVEWNLGAGARYQLTPYLALDGGVGKRLSGDEQSWSVTFGFARVFALRGLIGGR